MVVERDAHRSRSFPSGTRKLVEARDLRTLIETLAEIEGVTVEISDGRDGP
jgi:hemolysin activation/secretion protein